MTTTCLYVMPLRKTHLNFTEKAIKISMLVKSFWGISRLSCLYDDSDLHMSIFKLLVSTNARSWDH